MELTEMSIQYDSKESFCNCDPATQFLRAYLNKVIDSQLTEWAVLTEFPSDKLLKLKEKIIASCIEEFDLAYIIRGDEHLTNTRNKKDGYAVLLPSDEFEKHLKIPWEAELLEFYGQTTKSLCPESFITKNVIEQLRNSDRLYLKVDRVTEYNRIIQVFLNPKEVADSCIKWTLDYIPGDGSKERKCHLKEIMTASVSIHDTSSQPSVVCAMIISKLLKATGYNVNTKSYQTAPPWLETSEILVTFESTKQNCDKKIARWVIDASFHVDIDIDNVVIPYTLGRVTSILENYEMLMAKGDFPAVPPIDTVDFSVLTDSEEEMQLIMMLFYWPLVYPYIINIRTRCGNKIDVFFLINYVKNFGKKFEAYYSSVQVIKTRQAKHSVNTMMARIYLLKAIKKVFTEFSEIFGTPADPIDIPSQQVE